ncbi:MAG TPA: recombinase family protein [Clostridia bacterium]|nr:recombinase family protein [Clostridia bacterium]
MKQKRMAGYIRVSRIRNDEAISPENQKEKILLQAKLLGIPEDRIDFYIDLDYSGKDTNRPEFQRMMSSLHLYSSIIVYKLSRFSRSTVDFHQNITRLEKANVNLISVTENIDTSTPVGRLIRNIIVDFAQFEREVISEQVSDNMHLNASQGNWNGGTVPYGYKAVDKKLVVDPVTSEVVKKIFEMFAEGYGANVIRNELFRLGIKSPSDNTFWHKNTILNIIKNPVYIGKLQYGGKVYDAEHEGFIPIELWETCQKILKRRSETASRSVSSEHLLSGLIKCPKCGRNLNIRYNGRSDNAVRRYVCPGRNDSVIPCDCIIIDADSIEKSIVEKLHQLAKIPETIFQSRKAANSLMLVDNNALQEQEKQLKKELAKVRQSMKEMFFLYNDKKITIDQLEMMNTEYLEREKAIKKQLEEVEQILADQQAAHTNIARLERMILEFPVNWAHADRQEGRNLINSLIKEIRISDSGIVLDLYYSTVEIKVREIHRSVMKF